MSKRSAATSVEEAKKIVTPGRISAPPRVVVDARSNLYTVFYPGFRNTRQQAAKYAGSRGVPISGARGGLVFVTATFAPTIVHNLVALPEVPDAFYGWSWNPLHWVDRLISFGISKYLRYQNSRQFAISWTKLNIGGKFDQERCIGDVEIAVKELLKDAEKERVATSVPRPFPRTRKVVMFGCSRGGATTFYAALKLPKHLAEYVGLVIVEAPFDTLEAVTQSSSWFPKLSLRLLATVGRYTPEAYAFPDVTHLTCPIAFITSRADTRVPQHHTLALREELNRRFPHIETPSLELKRSHHSLMSYGCPDDQDAYVRFVDQLYEKYC